MWPVLRGEPASVIRVAGPLLLGGMLLFAASGHLGIPGTITSVFLIGLGASGRTFVHWQTERGLWMLAVLFLLLFGFAYGIIVFAEIADMVRGIAGPDVETTIEATMAGLLLAVQVRFLAQVARANWELSRGKNDD